MKVFFALFLVSSTLLSDPPSSLTDTLVIERLETALKDLKKSDSSRWKLIHRLADLYSERARIREKNLMAKELGTQALGRDCNSCGSPAEDRKKAIALYTEIFKRGLDPELDRIVLQIAHLHRLNGTQDEALIFFKTIIKQGHHQDIIALAHLSAGEISYHKTEFKEALTHFFKALESKNLPRKAQVIYRIAWSQLNQDMLEAATRNLEGLLKNPNYFAYKTSEGIAYDNSFFQEVAQDYATFLARGNVTSFEIEKLLTYGPERHRTENLFHLANELDRLGKKQASLLVWQLANNRQADPNHKLESRLRLAQVHYDMGNNRLAAQEFKAWNSDWKTSGCRDKSKCDELEAKGRKFLADWEKATRKIPSQDLYSSYVSFAAVFPNDVEIVYQAANHAKRLGLLNEAAQLYRRSASLAKSKLRQNLSNQARENTTKILEGSLLSEIEAAEMTKNPELREKAYQNYLKENPEGEKAHLVRYQLARIPYEKGQWNEAAEAFRKLVREKSFPKELKSKAADLAVDSLNLLKDDKRLEKWTLEFTEQVPERRKEYSIISRKATLNLVANNVNKDKASHSDLEKGLKTLQNISAEGLALKDKKSLLKDKVTLARKLRNLAEVEKSSNELLTLQASDEDDIFAYRNLLWIAECRLDFLEAYDLALKIKKVEPSKHIELSLAVYADLAGKNPEAHYLNYLDRIRGNPQALEIMANLIRTSKKPHVTFKKYESELRQSPNIYAALIVDQTLRTQNYRWASHKLSDFSHLPEAKAVQRLSKLKNFEQDSKQLSFHSLQTRSPQQLKRSLTDRVYLLQMAENHAKRAIAMGDWTLQIVHLDYLTKEYKRFYRDLLELPLPSHLNPKQLEQYKNILNQEAESYAQKAVALEVKITELWEQSHHREKLFSDYQNGFGSYRELVRQEMTYLLPTAPKDYSQQIQLALNTPTESEKTASIKELIRKDPFNAQAIEQLKGIEQKAGAISMVVFLNSRLQELKGAP